MSDHDLVAVIDHWLFCDRANGQNKTLRRVNDRGKAVDAHAAKIGNSEIPTLKFLRFHSLVAGAVSEVLRHFAELLKRFILGGTNHRSEQSIGNGDGDSKVDVGKL